MRTVYKNMNSDFGKYCFLGLVILVLNPSNAFGQDYSLQIYKTTIDLDTISLSGYETRFDQSYKEVRKAWWRYVKKKAVLKNHLSHYELKIPDSGNEANQPLYLVSQLEGNDSTAYRSLKIALRKHNLVIGRVAAVDKEVKQLLLDFKTNYYVEKIESQIEKQEKLSKKLSAQLDKLRTSKHRDDMDPVALQAKENGLLSGLKQIDQTLEKLKSQLGDIQ